MTGVLKDGIILDIMDHHNRIRIVPRTPCHQGHTWRMLKVSDRIFRGWGHPWHHGSSLHYIINFCAKFQPPSVVISVSRTPHPWNHTWRTWMVPDWSLGGLGHLWHPKSSWQTVIKLSRKFHEDQTSFGQAMRRRANRLLVSQPVRRLVRRTDPWDTSQIKIWCIS